MRCLPSSIFLFVFCNESIWLVCSLKINHTIGAPQNRRFYFEVSSSSPLAQQYRWMEHSICQSTWDKSEVLWRTCGEHIWNQGKMKKNLEWTKRVIGFVRFMTILEEQWKGWKGIIIFTVQQNRVVCVGLKVLFQANRIVGFHGLNLLS